MGKDTTGRSPLDFILSGTPAQQDTPLFETETFQPDTTDESLAAPQAQEQQYVPVPAGLPTINAPQRDPGSIRPAPSLAERLVDIAGRGLKTTKEYGEMARRGQNPVAAGEHLGRAVTQFIPAFVAFSMADEALRESKYTDFIPKGVEKILSPLAEGLDKLRKKTHDLIDSEQGQAFLYSRAINPQRVKEIVDETFGLGQEAAGIAAFGAATKYGVKGAVKGLDAFSRSRVGGQVAERLSEQLDKHLARSVQDQAPLPKIPPGGMGNIEGPAAPPGRPFLVSPEGTVVPPGQPKLREPKANIGGFMLDRPTTPLRARPQSAEQIAEYKRLGIPPIPTAPPMMLEGVQNVFKTVGEKDLRFEGYQSATGTMTVSDVLTYDTIEIPFHEFNAQTVKARFDAKRAPKYQEMNERGIGSIEEYYKLKREPGFNERYPRRPKDLASLATQEPGTGPRPQEPNIPVPSPPPPAPPVEGGVPGDQVRPIQSLYTHEGRERTGAVDESPRPAEPNIPPPSEKPPSEPPAEEVPPAPTPPPKPPAPAPAKGTVKIRTEKPEDKELARVKLEDLTTRTEDFQEREKPYAEGTVTSLLDMLRSGKKPQYPPIELWQDPQSGELVILSGHSRTEFQRRATAEGHKGYESIDAIIHKNMSFEEAKALAESSNLGTAATPVEKANAVRALRKTGVSESEIERVTKEKHGKQTQQIIKLSHLEQNGRVMDAVRAFVDKGEATTPEGRDMLNMAEWIGRVKKQHPELNARHEGEMFDFLKKNYKTLGKKFKTESEFANAMDGIIEKRTKFGAIDESLNFENLQPLPRSQEVIAAEFDARIAELQKGLTQKNATIARKLQNYQKKGLSEPEIKERLARDNAEREAFERDIATQVIKKSDAIRSLKNQELNLFDEEQQNPTYNDVLREAYRRFKEGGITFNEGFAAGIPIDATKLAYVLDPIMKKLQADAAALVESGSLRKEDVKRWMNAASNELLQKSKAFRDMGPKERQAAYKAIREKFDRLQYDPSTGTFYDLSKKDYDDARKRESDAMKAAASEEPKNPNMPSLIYDDGTPALYNSKNLSHTLWGKTRRLFFNKMGAYVAKQTMYGSNLVERMNFVDRRSGQWAEGHLLEYGRLSRQLNDRQFAEFVNLADQGGSSPDFHVNQMLEWWRTTAKEIITRAKAAGLETTYAQVTKNVLGERSIEIVSRPIGEREFYFPHEYEWKKLMDTDYSKVYIESLAKSEGISFSEAKDLYNKFLKSRAEMKYGHLEKPRLTSDSEMWSRKRDVIPSYIEKSTRRITTAEVFGKKHANAISDIQNIMEHGGDHWMAKELFDRWIGADYPTNSGGAWLYEMSRKVGSWQVASKLQLLFILNPTQFNNTALLWGMSRLVSESARQIGDFAKWREFAHRSAAITDQTVAMHMREAMSLEGIGGKVMEWTGVKMEERILRGNAAAVAGSIMGQWGKNLADTRTYRDAGAYLKLLDLDKQINLAKVKERGGFTQQELLDIGFEGARRTQFLSRPQDMPAFASTPEWKLFTQFKQFAVQQADLIWSVFKHLPPEKKARAALALGVAYPVSGALVNGVRDAINGRKKEEDAFMDYVRATATVGSFGILYDMLSQSSYNQSGFGMYITGPTIGDISKLGYGLMNPNVLPYTLSGQIPIPGVQQAAKRLTKPDEEKSREERRKEAREKAIERRDNRKRE